MKNRNNKLLQVILPLLLASSASRCDAKAFDPTPRTTCTTIGFYSDTGWQNQLTGATPNLHNYYWTPITHRIVNTTRTTERGATKAVSLIPRDVRHYTKPTHAPLPYIDHSRPQPSLFRMRPQSSQDASVPNTSTKIILSYSPGHPVSDDLRCTGAIESIHGSLISR